MTDRELLQAILQNTESAKLELHGLKGEVKGLKDFSNEFLHFFIILSPLSSRVKRAYQA